MASCFETREVALLTMRDQIKKVLDLILRSIAKRCISKDAVNEVEDAPGTAFEVNIRTNARRAGAASMNCGIHDFLLGRFQRRELLDHLALSRHQDAVGQRHDLG